MDRPGPPTRPTAVILAIAGGSGSGKTTLADALKTALSPRAVAVLREDDYYRDNQATPGFDPAHFNFDDVAARDHALMAEHLAALKAGNSIEMPRYDFVEHTRQPDRIPTGPAHIVIVEGTHVLCTNTLRPLFDHSIYLDVPDDIRLIRRIRRDIAERQRSVETVVRQYLDTVRPMHHLHTEPTRIYADRVVRFDQGTLTSEGEAMASLQRLIEEITYEIAKVRDRTP
jgi:uridine kinase